MAQCFSPRSFMVNLLISVFCGSLVSLISLFVGQHSIYLLVISPLFIAISIIGIFHFTSSGSFGLANFITLFRLNCVFWLVVNLFNEDEAWLYFALPAFLLDAADGWVARKLKLESVFGQFFDMETDNLLILAGGLAFGIRHDHWFAFVIGFIPCSYRYLFVLGCSIAKPVRQKLPPALRRKLICVIQMFAAIFQFTYISPLKNINFLTDFLWITSWILLTLSFVIDIKYLYKANSSSNINTF